MSAHVHSYISQYYSNSWHETTLDHLRGRNDNWAIRHDDRSRYGKYFERYQKYNKRPMTRAIFAQYYTWKQVIDPVKDGLQELVAFQLAECVLFNPSRTRIKKRELAFRSINILFCGCLI